MVIIRKFLLLLVALCIILSLTACAGSGEVIKDNIFVYNDNIQIFYDDTSSGKLERTEIFLSENAVDSLINSLAAYSNMLSDDTLKKEFVCWYTVKLDDATTLQIDAEPISSGSSDLTYMYVVQHTTEPATLSGTFIDCAIIKQLKNAYDEA